MGYIAGKPAGAKANGLKYEASSLEDIAEAFESLAKTAFTTAARADITQKERRFHEGVGSTWNAAAQTLRSTVIIPK